MSDSSLNLPDWPKPLAATWITTPVLGGPRTVSPAVYYRRSFAIEKPAGRAFLHITALGILQCEINGRRVGHDVFAPGWTDYRKRVYYHTYEVTDLLQPGENVIGVILGDGWYSGHVAEKDRQLYGEHPALLASLEDDSAEVLLASDSSWSRSIGPILENDLLMGESYDARRELGAWSSPGYDDAGWLPAVAMPAPSTMIERSPGPPVRRQEILPGRLLSTGPDVPWVPSQRLFDFGQNFTGRVRIRVSGPRGLHLRMRHGEILKPDGSLYTENLRTARATDHYTLKGEGIEEWEPCFTFHGFRYCELNWQKSGVALAIESVEGIVLHSDTPRTGHFSCSHALLNQLASNIVWGQKGNFLEVPTDCPQRDERLGWTGDAQAFVRTASFFMDVRGFFHKWLQDMRDAQGEDGAIPPIIPNTHSFGLPGDGGPAWADAAFICPWTIYLCYGDTEILSEHYASMVRYLDYLAANKVKDHIRCHPEKDDWGGFGDWLALDGSGRMEGGTPKELIGTAFYANGADIVAKTAEILGHTEDAARFRALHGEIVKAFVARFITPEGHVIGGTQTGYVLALHFGLLPKALRANAANELVRLIARNGFHIGTGFVGTPYIQHVLEATGHLDTAYKLLEQESFPSWLFPVKNGATTIWERWDGWTPEKGFQDVGMNSFNHYAYGAVGDWMVSTVAGLQFDPAQPGYRHILFKPRPGGTLTWAEARLQTPHGETSIRWELKEGQLVLDLVVPDGATATLSPPDGWNHALEILSAGSHRIVMDSSKS
ncbi:MAG: family 78 glycoside hydrolase catalytic domain [Verrucomicrobia bacterium]|nr:family 78 glycoside hydrolase catalytic domain [Verrucomicrobiota bacterium]